MKKIKVHPGVVLLSVCDEHLLISTLEARKDLPYIQQIDVTCKRFKNFEPNIICTKIFRLKHLCKYLIGKCSQRIFIIFAVDE